MQTLTSLPVAIIGAGPVGLAAAAHLSIRKQPFILLEKGNTVANNILSWKHIRVFSPWRYNIDHAARTLLINSGWQPPLDDGLPTGDELYHLYLQPLAELDVLKSHIHFDAEVVFIARKGTDKMKTHGRTELPYVIQFRQGGKMKYVDVKGVIDASGTWHNPNPIGSTGTYVEGEVENRARISYGLPDVLNAYSSRYRNKNVVVAGGGHSAINAILDLDKLKDEYPLTTIHWLVRKKDIAEVYGGQQADALKARGELGVRIEQLTNSDRVRVYTSVHIQRIDNTNDKLIITGVHQDLPFRLDNIDEFICNTGSRPDFSFQREVRLSIDSSLESVAAIASLIDPNVHSCGTVRPHGEKELRHPDTGFYIVGAKSYGRAPTFLMATGYEQVRSIAAAIAGDTAAALQVALELPATGVCSVNNQFGNGMYVRSEPQCGNGDKPSTGINCCG